MKHRICLFDVTPSHYRKEIFELIDKSFDVHFYFGDMMPSIKKMDITVLKGAQKALHVVMFGPFFWYKGMLTKVGANYDVCIFDGDYRCLSTWFALIRCKLGRKRSYLWTHGFYGDEKGIIGFIKKAFFRLATGGLVYGNYAKGIMVDKYHIPEDKLHVIHNSLDYSNQLVIRNKLKPSDIYVRHFGNENPVLLFIGRLTAVKRLDMILSAKHILQENGIDTNLVLIGDGVEKESLEKLSTGYAFGNSVWFYGASYDEITNAELIYNADICISPGNIGLTAIHTLTYGTPAITHNKWSEQMPEFEAITKDETGDFFEYDNVHSLAETIKKWFQKDKPRDQIRQSCYHSIDTSWNPNYQIQVLKKAIGDE